MIDRILIVIIVLILLNTAVLAQETHEKGSQEYRNMLMFTFGYTHIPKGAELNAAEAEGFFVPSVGLDYVRRIGHRWEFGLLLDYELDHYLIVEEEFERENAFIAVAGLGYELIEHFALMAGAGIEIEKNENLFVFRLGAEYGIHFNNRWVLAPAFFYDFKEGYDTYSLSLGIGYNF
jgi:hypothetical protein